MKKRTFLWAAIAFGGSAIFTRYLLRDSKDMASTNAKMTQKTFEIQKTDSDWRKTLTSEQYRVLRQHGTERAGSSPLDKEYDKGTYVCAGCNSPLFTSDTKFNSGTGWPSFYAPIEDAVGTTIDNSLFMTRVEVHCRRCGGHLGHVFQDGPQPTGERYCMNGVAMKFILG